MLRLYWGRSGLLAGVVLATMLSLVSAPAQAGQPDLQRARQATAAYHDQGKALDAGYQAFLSCFDDATFGGMGQHYVNFDLMDGTVDAAAPEALVYEVTPSGEKLVAVEYLVPFDAMTANGPAPTLFGTEFTPSSLGVWELHAWIWEPNDAGMHADYNPSVAMCP
jgi:hypothetical protein